MRRANFIIMTAILLGALLPLRLVQAQGVVVYYVSASTGNDSNNGLSAGAPFKSVTKVNSLALQPGDSVLFKCGDVWRADPLTIVKSGASGKPITFGSYPAADCANQPALSGSQPISGWTAQGNAIYAADLSAGANAGKFPNGINQLFRNDERLTLGRWPNLNAANGGYAQVEAQPASNRLTDAQLPSGNWSGAALHIKTIRWLLLNRNVTASSGTTLTVNDALSCWDGTCAGWGYFLNNHRLTLDQDGEWYYDSAANRVYLVSTGGAPAGIEGSVIIDVDSSDWGGVVLGHHLMEHITYVTIQNLAVKNWYQHGITTPTNLEKADNGYLTIRYNTIRNVEAAGINLAVWIYDATDGVDGWRGGHHLTVSGNTIDGANYYGVDTYSVDSTFEDNIIRNIGLIKNLGQNGLGCSFEGDNCTENGDGFRIKLDNPLHSARANVLRYNRLNGIAYNGVDVFGPDNLLDSNVIELACSTKGDCGGVRTFGRDNLTSTDVHGLTIRNNIIINPVGNTDGDNASFKPLFGMGLYIDNYSRDVTVTGNTIISATITGILYQNSTGRITGNTLYNNGRGTMVSPQVGLYESATRVSEMSGNILFALNPSARTLGLNSLGRLASSNNNYFFHPYLSRHIAAGGDKTLAQWHSYSGQDGASVEHWYTQSAGQPPRSRIFYNDTKSARTVDLGATAYLDLDQNAVVGSITLSPFSSIILIENGLAGLTLQSISPVMWGADEAANFTLTAAGSGFTAQSVVRWNGSARPTQFVSSSRLTAAISAADVDTAGAVQVTVYNAGEETAALPFKIAPSLARGYLPLIAK